MNDNYKGKKTYYVMKYSFIFIMSLLLLSFTSAALDNYPTQKINQNFTFCQVCADATYVYLTSIESPDGKIGVYSNMTNTGLGEYCYNYSPTSIGTYDFRGISDGCDKEFAVHVEVTPSGFLGTLGFYLVIILLLALLIFMGFYISEEWFVILGGLGLMMLGIYSINSGIAGFRDMFMTWGVGLFEIGVGFILAMKSSFELFKD